MTTQMLIETDGLVEKLSEAINEADAAFYYSKSLTRLVDGNHTYKVTIRYKEGGPLIAFVLSDDETDEYDANAVCYEIINRHKADARADAMMGAIRAARVR